MIYPNITLYLWYMNGFIENVIVDKANNLSTPYIKVFDLLENIFKSATSDTRDVRNKNVEYDNNIVFGESYYVCTQTYFDIAILLKNYSFDDITLLIEEYLYYCKDISNVAVELNINYLL